MKRPNDPHETGFLLGRISSVITPGAFKFKLGALPGTNGTSAAKASGYRNGAVFVATSQHSTHLCINPKRDLQRTLYLKPLDYSSRPLNPRPINPKPGILNP